MFEPIVWDLMPFLGNNVPLNSNQSNLLFTKINRIPAFVEKRNFFVHRMFNAKEFGLASDDQCKKSEDFLHDLQDYAWNVQNIFLGCLINWMRDNGVYEHMPDEIKGNKHLRQVEQKSFHVLFREPDKSGNLTQPTKKKRRGPKR